MSVSNFAGLFCSLTQNGTGDMDPLVLYCVDASCRSLFHDLHYLSRMAPCPAPYYFPRRMS